MNEAKLVDQLIKCKLESGKVTLWTYGNDSLNQNALTQNARKLLYDMKIDYQEFSLKEMDKKIASYTKLALSMHTGYSLFPNIYFGKEHIGGFDDL